MQVLDHQRRPLSRSVEHSLQLREHPRLFRRRATAITRGEVGGLDAVGHAELVQHVGHVHGGGTRADVQPLGDLAVSQAGRQCLEHVAFAAGE